VINSLLIGGGVRIGVYTKCEKIHFFEFGIKMFSKICLVPEYSMLCFARIILQRAKCAITLRTMHELLGADSTMYIGHYLDLLQVGP